MGDWDRGAAASSKINLRISEINHRINFEFDFPAIIEDILNLIEDTTVFKGCVLSAVNPDFGKKPLFSSSSLSPTILEGRTPILALPITLANNELKYTLDIYGLDAPQLSQRDYSKLHDEYHSLLYQAVNKDYIQRDPLTGAFNRSYLNAKLDEVLEVARRNGSEVAIGMADLDFFKKVNDNFGHPAGDHVLKTFTEILTDVIAGNGFVARYGGEEFVFVLQGLDPSRSVKLAEDIRTTCKANPILVDETENLKVQITTSIGLAFFPTHGDDVDALIKAADKALYLSKDGGRDRVTVLETPTEIVREAEAAASVAPSAPRTKPILLESTAVVKSLADLEAVRGTPIAAAVMGPYLYILDRRENKVHLFDGNKKAFTGTFGRRGEAPDELENPVDLTVDRERNVWVVDSSSHAVKKYDPSGRFQFFIGGRDKAGNPVAGNAKGSFTSPWTVTYDSKGRILVAESSQRRVQRFTTDGNFDELEIYLSLGEDTSYSAFINDVDVDRTDALYVLDSSNNYVYKFSPEGEFLTAFGGHSRGGKPGSFNGLTALAVDRSGSLAKMVRKLYGSSVDEVLGNGIIVTAERGDQPRLQFFCADGTFIGALDFSRIFHDRRSVQPVNLTVGGKGGIYIVDQENNDILLVQFKV
jgi:diguanylate cyclase (GGDEF)-like protein